MWNGGGSWKWNFGTGSVFSSCSIVYHKLKTLLIKYFKTIIYELC